MEFENEFFKCRVHLMDGCKQIKITGIVMNRMLYKNVLLIAPNSANKNASYSGTGLPFPCADVAFEGSPNVYSVDISGNIDTVFTYPNSYYSAALKSKIISSIFAVIEHQNGHTDYIRMQLKDLYPLRTLTNRETRTGPEFYEYKHEMLPVDTAYNIMREYARIKIAYGIA